jgi:hypothetical protein
MKKMRFFKWLRRPDVVLALACLYVAIFMVLVVKRIMQHRERRELFHYEQLKLPVLHEKDSMMHKN